MPTPLEKARQDPESMKGRILASAIKLFGLNGFQGTTTRMIAKDVGIDISTLYYHWGEKKDLYESVIIDLNDSVSQKLKEIERVIRGKPLATRMDISIDMVCDYLFDRPEISNIFLYRYIPTSHNDENIDVIIPEYISNIAISLGMALDKKEISVQTKARVLAAFHSIFNFISGEHYFRPFLGISHEEYVGIVKDTLKFILIPAFTQESMNNPTHHES